MSPLLPPSGSSRAPLSSAVRTRPPHVPHLTLFPDGAARIGATVFGELLNAVFANIGQRAIRKVSRETFEHLLNLNLKFHLSRQTGGLTRAIDRGTKYGSLIFTIPLSLISQQGHHIYATGYPVPYRPYCPGDIHGVRHPRRCRPLSLDASIDCILDV